MKKFLTILVFPYLVFCVDATTVFQTDTLILGSTVNAATTDKAIKFQRGPGAYPTIKWDKTTQKLNFSHDGSTFKQINKALDLDTTGISANKFLIGDGSGGITSRSPLATELDTTGVPSGYVLGSNGSGGVSSIDLSVAVPSIPTGAIMIYSGTTAPAGWLLCDGSSIPNGTGTVQGQTANFSALYAIIGTRYGGSGNLPNTSGVFVRGAGSQQIGPETYTGVLAQRQTDRMENHNHGGATGISTVPAQGSNFQLGSTVGPLAGTGSTGNTTLTNSSHSHTITDNGVGTENYPANITLNYIIKY